MLEKINEKSNELVELKTKIHKANTPVYDKIFRLSELKSTIARLKSLDCTEGVSTDYYSRNRENPPVKTAEVSVVDRDEMVNFMEEQIEDLQDILDNHNQNTEI
jgi:thymidine kinase